MVWSVCVCVCVCVCVRVRMHTLISCGRFGGDAGEQTFHAAMMEKRNEEQVDFSSVF